MTTLLKKFRFSILVLFVVTISACSNEDDDTRPAPNADYTSAEAYLEDIDFKGSVLIRKGNTDLLREGFGVADKNTGMLNDPSLIYRIGSVTKSFTSAAVVNLKRDGLLQSYDQPISDFDEDFPYGDQITIRHLLTHHSGIPDYVGGVTAFVEENNYFIETEEIYDIIKEAVIEDGLAFTPGEFFNYSNSNYLILGLLIEELTDMSYQEYLQQKVYTPLGLNHTAKGPDEINGSARAQGYNQGTEAAPYQMQIAYSAGELESTIGDLEKWGDALLGHFFTEEEKQLFFAAPIQQEGVNTPGAGWFTRSFEGQVVYHHGGDINGFTSFLVLLPASNSMIILLSNEQDKGEQRNQILETIMQNEF